MTSLSNGLLIEQEIFGVDQFCFIDLFDAKLETSKGASENSFDKFSKLVVMLGLDFVLNYVDFEEKSV